MRVNASQVHEARMIATHVYKFVKRFDKKTKLSAVHPAPKLQCALCLRRNTFSAPRPAVTVYEGTAVCQTHLQTL